MTIAYFSMEFGISQDLPIYSGGLGVLAGDTLKSCADLELPVVGIGLLYTHGYFRQAIKHRKQIEFRTLWNYDEIVDRISTIEVEVEGHNTKVAVYRYHVNGATGYEVPLLLLSTDIDENEEWQKEITSKLYRADHKWWRIVQEVILGIGGMRALEKLDIKPSTYHLNEGHAAFAILEHVRKNPSKTLEEVKQKFAFTTHTPVAAGFDRFDISLVKQVLGDTYDTGLELLKPFEGKEVNMALLAFEGSRIVNAVAKKHEEVTKKMFPQYANKTISITNGVHHLTWMNKYVKNLIESLNEEDGIDILSPSTLVLVENKIKDIVFRSSLVKAHLKAKKEMINELNLGFNETDIVICYARRSAGYKRPDLIVHDIERLKNLGYPIQLVISGKSHPDDNVGKSKIENIMNVIKKNAENSNIKIVFVENYNMDKAKFLISGSDVWLNNPLPPFEASGTSGMKAALNGIPQLSTLDGWWIEAKEDTGWSFGDEPKDNYNENDLRYEYDSGLLYEKLKDVLETFYKQKETWVDIMIKAIARNGSYFNTHRMVEEYAEKIWNLSI